MFTFRRKPSKQPESPKIRGSPSLPQLNSQGIPWPENLVDLDSIRDSVDTPPTTASPQGATKTSFGMDPQTPISFHKPFRLAGNNPEGGRISSMYMASAPSAFDNWKSSPPVPTSKYSQRRARTPPTFNLMVVGGQGTGKTSLLRLLLETADISPTATPDQRAEVAQFLKGSPQTTHAINTTSVEICESRFDRIAFSVIDTPGLDFQEGRELKMERQVTSILRYVDAKYADTMSEESKVIRKSKGDQHIHLCIYMIDPSSIMPASTRRQHSALPSKTRSETTIANNSTTNNRTPPDLITDTSPVEIDAEDGEHALTMSPAELRVIRRLSSRSNVLPVIARADSLTDENLAAVKKAVRAGLAEAGLNFGVFSPKKNIAVPRRKSHHVQSPTESIGNGNGSANGNGNGNGHVSDDEGNQEEDDNEDESEEAEEERKTRPVIKLRPARHSTARNLSRSRSRRDLSVAADDDRRPMTPDMADKDSVANVRFSAHVVAKMDLESLMPFALIAPQPGRHRHRPSELHTNPSSPVSPSEDDHGLSVDSVAAPPRTPVSVHSSHKQFGFLHGPPEDLKGVFVRKFRWGTVDVLDPDHCDYAALRTAVLSTHFKVLKTHTKEVLYEQFRTEKLLARRATRQITEDEQQKILEDLERGL